MTQATSPATFLRAQAQDQAPAGRSPRATPGLGLLGLIADLISGGKISELRERLDRSLENEARLYNDIHRETITADHATSALRSVQKELSSSKALNQELIRMAGIQPAGPPLNPRRP